MKKRIAFLTAVFLLIGLIVGCGLIQEPNNLQESEKPKETSPKETEGTEPTEPDEEDEPAGYVVEMVIADYGTIKLQLDRTAAPITVDNFVKLVNGGFYNGLTFHRIMADFMMQGGDPQGNGTGGSGTKIKGEFSANGWDNPISHTRGTISMARAKEYDSASSQFFIVHEDSLFLDGNYAAFGWVVEGMEVVDAVCRTAQPVDYNGTIPASAQPVIESVTVVEVLQEAVERPTDTIPTTMLDFKNKDQYQAEQMLKELVANNPELALSYQFMYEYSNEVEEGCVIRTEPACGEPLTKGVTMYVYMSQGKDPGTTIIMDNFIGKEQDITETTLRNYEMGLQIKIEKQYSEVIEKGLVCGTSPEKGKTVRPNQEVIIYISDGREMFTMPNLLVQPYKNDYINAKVYLEERGYNTDKLVKNEVYSDTVPAGELMGQSVEAGTKYPVNDEIVLTVSLGPRPPQTVTYTITFTGNAEEYLKVDCDFWIENSAGERIGDITRIVAGTESIEITLTGNGVQSYTYCLHQTVGNTSDLRENFEVNFEPTEAI